MSVGSAAGGRLIEGPYAFGPDPRRFGNLVLTLATTDFKLQFFGSFLGYLWQLMRPLLLFGVLYVVFTEFLRIGVEVPFYGAVLLTNIVVYTFFADATGNAVSSLTEREGLVRKVQFPLFVIPLSVVLRAYFNVLLNFAAVAVFIAVSGAGFHATAVELPLLLLALGVLGTGVAALLSSLHVRFRDIKPIWGVFLRVLFYGSPILYTLELIPEGLGRLLVILNPLAPVLQQVRHAVIDPSAASAAEAAGGWAWLLIPAAMSVGIFVLGLWVFRRETPRIGERM